MQRRGASGQLDYYKTLRNYTGTFKSGVLNKASNAGYRVLDGPVRLAVASGTHAGLV